MVSSNIKTIINLLVKESLQTKKHHGMLESLQHLQEAKFDDIKNKYPFLMGRLDRFKAVPSKYLEWIAKKLPTIQDYEDEELVDLINKFEELAKQQRLEKKDINAYKSVDDLKTAVELVPPSKTQIKKKSKSDAKLIYQDEVWTVLEPTSVESSCYYGYGTKWCISAREENYYQQYTGEGVRFAFVINKSNNNKIAVALYPSKKFEIYDAQDKTMPTSVFVQSTTPEVVDAINGWAEHPIIVSSEESINKLFKAIDEKNWNKARALFYGMKITGSRFVPEQDMIRHIIPRLTSDNIYFFLGQELYKYDKFVFELTKKIIEFGPTLEELAWHMAQTSKEKGASYEEPIEDRFGLSLYGNYLTKVKQWSNLGELAYFLNLMEEMDLSATFKGTYSSLYDKLLYAIASHYGLRMATDGIMQEWLDYIRNTFYHITGESNLEPHKKTIERAVDSSVKRFRMGSEESVRNYIMDYLRQEFSLDYMGRYIMKGLRFSSKLSGIPIQEANF